MTGPKKSAGAMEDTGMKWLSEFGACSLAAARVPCDGFDEPALDEDDVENLEMDPAEPAVGLEAGGAPTAH